MLALHKWATRYDHSSLIAAVERFLFVRHASPFFQEGLVAPQKDGVEIFLTIGI